MIDIKGFLETRLVRMGAHFPLAVVGMRRWQTSANGSVSFNTQKEESHAAT